MFNTNMSNKIVTNLRIEKEKWVQIKSQASEMGMSVNEYVNYLITDLSIKRELINDFDKAPIWQLPEIHKKVKYAPMGLSEEDEIIYGN